MRTFREQGSQCRYYVIYVFSFISKTINSKISTGSPIHSPVSPVWAKRRCLLLCIWVQRTRSPSNQQCGKPNQTGLFLSTWPEKISGWYRYLWAGKMCWSVASVLYKYELITHPLVVEIQYHYRIAMWLIYWDFLQWWTTSNKNQQHRISEQTLERYYINRQGKHQCHSLQVGSCLHVIA